MKKLILLSLLIVGSVFAREYIAIIEFEGIGVSQQEARSLTQRLTSEMIKLEVYQVLERAEMKKLLDEQKFQSSGCVSTQCAVDIGKMLGAKYMIVGSVNKVGRTFSIDARMIDVETSESYVSANYDYTGEIDLLLKQGMKNVAYQLSEIDNIKLIEKEIITDDVNTINKSKSDFSNNKISVGLGFGTIKTHNAVLISYDIKLSPNMAIYPLLGWPATFAGIGLDYQQNYNQNGFVFCASYGFDTNLNPRYVFQSAYQWQIGDEPNYFSMGVGYWQYEFYDEIIGETWNVIDEGVEKTIIPVISFNRRF